MNGNVKAGLAALVVVVLVVGAGLFLLDEGGDPKPSPQATRSAGPGPVGPSRTPVAPPPPTGKTPAGSSGGAKTGPHGRPAGGNGKTSGNPSGGGKTGPGPRPTASRGGAPVSFKVICEDGTGHPLPGVRIEARRKSGMPLQPVMSDAQGHAVLGGLPSGEGITGVARHPRVDGAVPFGPVVVEQGSSLRVRMNLSRLGRLVGRIVDQQGQGVREAEVVLVNPKEQEGEAVLDTAALGLDANGGFAAQVAAGHYAVSARGPGFSESDRAYVQVPPDADSAPVNLVVSRKSSITGQLHLPPDVAQIRPLELDVVIESESGTERNPLTRTERRRLQPNQDLSFQLENVHAGRVRIRIELPRAGDHRVGPWTKVDLSPGQAVTGVLVSLAEVTVAIRGTIRDDRGVVVPNASVSVGSRVVKTDLQGGYMIRGLDMGEAGVEATLEGHAKAYQAIDYQGSQLEVNLVLKRYGEVMGEVTGEGVNGIPVILIRTVDGAVETLNATADAAGRYHFKEVPPGTYHVKAGKGADPFDTSGAPQVTVQPGQQARVDPVSR